MAPKRAPAEPEIRIEPIDPVARGMTADGLSKLCDDELALARRLADATKRLDLDDPSRVSWQATFGRFDDALLALANASEFPLLMAVAHPDEAVRRAAERCEQQTEALRTTLYADMTLARPLKAYADRAQEQSEERQRFVEQVLRDFRRGGVDLPAENQQRLAQIDRRLTELGQRFIAEIAVPEAPILFKPAELAGLSESFIDGHPPGADGKVRVFADQRDYDEVVRDALDREKARELFVRFVNRGGDLNVSRLDRILELRHEKARLLGYDSWADYAIEPRMMKTVAAARALLARIKQATLAPAARELKELQEQKRSLPGASPNEPLIEPDRLFLVERIAKKRLGLDRRELSQYFEVERTTQVLIELTSSAYDVEYRPLAERAWHPSVKVYEVRSGGASLGKLYLDLLARPDKHEGAAMFSLRSGKTFPSGRRQTPIAALVASFAAPGQPMSHEQVLSCFHEFGHAMEHLLSQTELYAMSGANGARDFVETGAELMEEWAWAPEVLARLGRHRKTGAPLPQAMIGALVKSRRVGLALAGQRQLFLADLDLAYHTTTPPFDTTALLERTQARDCSFRFVEGTHMQSSFAHWIGYDAGYYGYLWSMALAWDALSRFRRDGLFDNKANADWRDLVLKKGASRDERAMLRDFLGREPSEDAYLQWVGGG